MDPLDLTEAESVAFALVQRLREGSIPPDDAYWWARIVATSFSQLEDATYAEWVVKSQAS